MTIEQKDPLPDVNIDKEFTEKFLRACKNDDLDLPSTAIEGEIKAYLAHKTHK